MSISFQLLITHLPVETAVNGVSSQASPQLIYYQLDNFNYHLQPFLQLSQKIHFKVQLDAKKKMSLRFLHIFGGLVIKEYL